MISRHLINTLCFFFLSFNVWGQISFEPEDKITREQSHLTWSDNFKLVGDFALIWDDEYLFTFKQTSKKEIALIKKQALKLPQETKVVPYNNKNMFISFPNSSYRMVNRAEIYSFEDGQWGKVKEITLPSDFSSLFGHGYEFSELRFTPDNMLLYPEVKDRSSLESDIPIFSLSNDEIEVAQLLPTSSDTNSIRYDSINSRLLLLSQRDGLQIISIYEYSLQAGKFNLINSVKFESGLYGVRSMGVINSSENKVELYFSNYSFEVSAIRLDYQSLNFESITTEKDIVIHSSSQLIQHYDRLLNLTTGWLFDGNNFGLNYQKRTSSNNLTVYSVYQNKLIIDKEINQSVDERYSRQQRLAIAEDNTVWLFQIGRGVAVLNDELTINTLYLFDEKNNWSETKTWSKNFNESTRTLTFNDKKGLYQVDLLQKQELDFQGYDYLSEKLEEKEKLSSNRLIHTLFGSLILGSENDYGKMFSILKNESLAANFEFEPVKLPFHFTPYWHQNGPYLGSYVFVKNTSTLFVNLDAKNQQYLGLYVIQFDDNLNIVATTKNNQDGSISKYARYLYVNNYFVTIRGGVLTSYSVSDDGVLIEKHTYESKSGDWFMGNSASIDNGINTEQHILRMDDNLKWYAVEVDQNGQFFERPLPQNIHDPRLKGENEYLSTQPCSLEFIDEYHAVFCENFYRVSGDKQRWELLAKPNFENDHNDFIYDTSTDNSQKALLIKDSYTQVFNLRRAPIVTDKLDVKMTDKDTLNISLYEYVTDVDNEDVLSFKLLQPSTFILIDENGDLSITTPEPGAYQLDIEITDSHSLSTVLPMSIKVSEVNEIEILPETKSGGSISFLLLLTCLSLSFTRYKAGNIHSHLVSKQ